MTLDLLSHVRHESARFAAVLHGVDASARVPTCPDWTAADLLWHLSEVHDFWARIVAGRVTDESAIEAIEAGAPQRPDDQHALFELYDSTTEHLLTELATARDDEPVWTWSAQQDVGFVRRFQAHEALMHRVDAESAAGTLTPLPTDLASDGVDLVLRLVKTWRPAWAPWTRSGGVGLLHATDTGQSWQVVRGTWGGLSPESGRVFEAEPSIEVVEPDGSHTFTVRAPAETLDAWLWTRPGYGDLERTGDAGHLSEFDAIVAAGVQ